MRFTRKVYFMAESSETDPITSDPLEPTPQLSDYRFNVTSNIDANIFPAYGTTGFIVIRCQHKFDTNSRIQLDGVMYTPIEAAYEKVADDFSRKIYSKRYVRIGGQSNGRD